MAEVLSFPVASSDGTKTYTVDFEFSDNNKLWVICSCPAGQHRQLCKHVLEIFAGHYQPIEYELLDEEYEGLSDNFEKIMDIIDRTDFKDMSQTLWKLNRELKKIQEQARPIQRKIEEVKGGLAYAIKNGISVKAR